MSMLSVLAGERRACANTTSVRMISLVPWLLGTRLRIMKPHTLAPGHEAKNDQPRTLAPGHEAKNNEASYPGSWARG